MSEYLNHHVDVNEPTSDHVQQEEASFVKVVEHDAPEDNSILSLRSS